MASGPFPVIGIMAHPAVSNVTTCGGSCQYIAASYVKFVESAGARAIPINYHSTDDEIDEVMNQVNGILFPGGSADVPPAAKRIVENAMHISSVGGHFPVYGICLGFEWLALAVAGQDVLTGGMDAENISLSLNFTSEANHSRLFHDDSARTIFAEQAVTMNNHHLGLLPTTFKKNPKLQSVFKLLSTNMDRNGVEFVSSMEGHIAPIYGTQFHPEKNIFEWGTFPDGRPYEVIQHNSLAVQSSQSLANFFVGEARKNSNVYNLTLRDKFFEHLLTDAARDPVFVEVYHLFPQHVIV